MTSALAIGVVVAVSAAPAAAATLTVDTAADEMAGGDGTCSLREAVGAVDSPGTLGDCGSAAFGANTIALGAQQYVLSRHGAGADNATGDLNLVGTVTDLTIAGAGTTATVIDATGLGDRVLAVAAGAKATVADLTITGGHAPDGSAGAAGATSTTGNGGNGGGGGPGGSGGGIRNAGTLTLSGTALIDNAAGNGGFGGAGGSAENPSGGGGSGGGGGPAGGGGGVFNASTGTLTVAETTIAGNHGGSGGNGGAGGLSENANGGPGGPGSGFGDGGGVYNSGGTLTIADSTIDGNFAGDGGEGGNGGPSVSGNGGNGGNGGVASWGGGLVSIGPLSLTNSTIAANHGGNGGDGGDGGEGGITPSSVGGNGGTGGGGGDGGGLVAWGSDSLVNTTLAGNAVGIVGVGGNAGLPGGSAGGTTLTPPAGGGVWVPSGPLTLQNTLVASNGGGNCAGPGAITDGGHDLSFGDTSCPGISGDPELGVLGDHGGPTQTIALGAGSAAIDGVPSSGAGCPPTDQRGVPRPFGAGCDIGAYEVRPPDVSTGEAGAITGDRATVAGAVTPNSGDAAVHFDFGPTASYGSSSPSRHLGGIGSVAVSADLSGLASDTTYHYRLVATSADGTAEGTDRTFTTANTRPEPPNTVISKAKISSAKHRATFRFRATGQATGFQCALVSKKRKRPRFRTCRSPKTYRKLKPGRYLFEVRAVGPGGPDPSPAKRRFKIA